MGSEWPFVGRADEVERLHSLLTGRARSGAVITGPAGVGKTRLAVECLKKAERAGLATIRVTGSRSARSIPYGALAGVLRSNGQAPAMAELPDLLRRSEANLAGQSKGRRLVLMVDDAHLLDDASATLVYHLAANGSAFVLATTRASDPAPDPIVALWKEDLAERIELCTLGPAAMEQLLGAALGGPVDSNALSELLGRARGNVLFVRELVQGALEDGVLTEEDGLWRLRGRVRLPHRLIELAELRLGGTDLAERALLELVAFGEPVGEAELNALADPDLADALERRGLLTSAMNGRRLEVRLSHPLYGEVLRAGVPAVRERAIARALAEVVEATGARRREDALRIAAWRLVGGGGRPEVMLAGAVSARWHYDFGLAEALAQAAVKAGDGFEAALLAAELAGLQGRTEEAEEALARLVPEVTDDGRRARLALTRIHNSVMWAGRDPMDLLEAARATITDPEWLDRLEAEHLMFVELTAGPNAVAQAATPLLERARGEALAVACIPTAVCLGRLGRVTRALEVADRGKAAHAATSRRLSWYPWWHDVTRCLALYVGGQLDDAAALANAQYSLAITERSPEAQTIFALLPAVMANERGRVWTAAHRAREALWHAQRLGRPVLVRFGHLYGALVFALSGRSQEAKECLAALDALGLADVVDSVDEMQARAWTAVAIGELAHARQHLADAAELGHDIGDRIGATAALHGLARLGYPDDVYDRLAAIGADIEGDLIGARVAHTHGLACHDATELEATSREFERMGADLLAGEAAADAAVVRRRSGQARQAVAAANRAALLAERCEFPGTPAFQPVETRAKLTPPERETAVLAARGLPNRRIADHLHLSVRTVENRLQRVYQKLGISRRTDLPEALSAPPKQPRTRHMR